MRLIDADALYELIDGGFDLDFSEVPETKQELLRMINDCPTIGDEAGINEWCIDCEEYDKERHRCPRFNRVIRDAMDELRTVPPVKHGRWEDKTVNNCRIDEWQSARCSACGRYHTTPYLYYFTDDQYCPCCGAKMDLEGEAHETD